MQIEPDCYLISQSSVKWVSTEEGATGHKSTEGTGWAIKGFKISKHEEGLELKRHMDID